MQRTTLCLVLASGLLGASGCDDVCKDGKRWFEGACRSEPKSCGSPEPACQDCSAPGAERHCSHFNPGYCWCECPTGDSGCPCWDSSHCQHSCVAEWDGPCEEKTFGTCAERTPTWHGSYCQIDDGVGTIIQWE